MIDESEDRRLADRYNESPNVHLFGIEDDDQIVASIRIHVCTQQTPAAPAMESYGDVLSSWLDRGDTFVDPSRFVVGPRSRRVMGNLPFATIRLAAMAAEHYGADHVLATVRTEHAAFYRRFFGMTQLTEPRTYFSLKRPLSLMSGRWHEMKAGSYSKVPDFDSTSAERDGLFGRVAA